MLTRFASSLFVMTAYGARGSIVNLVTSLQSRRGRALLEL
jgi:hypothetical protein